MRVFLILSTLVLPLTAVEQCWSDLVSGKAKPGAGGQCWPGTTQCYKQTDTVNGYSTTLYGCDTINNCYGISNGKCKSADMGGGIKRRTCCCGTDLCNTSSRSFQPIIFGIFALISFVLSS